MNSEDPTLQRFRISYLIALALIALVATASWFTLDRLTGSQSASSTVINVAGRQRMLSQQLVKAALGHVYGVGSPQAATDFRQEMIATHARLLYVNERLREGDLRVELPGALTPDIMAVEDRLLGVLQQMSVALERLLVDPSDSDALNLLLAEQRRFLSMQDDIVERIEALSIEQIERYRQLSSVLLVATLLALVGVSVGLFEPVLRAFRRQFALLADANRHMIWHARHDELTCLPTRGALSLELDDLVAGAATGGADEFAVYFLDFDGFKHVNDSLGHGVGDQLLCGIASRLMELVAQTSSESGCELKAFRLGGDEFVMILSGPTALAEAVPLAQRAIDALAQVHRLGEHECSCTASIGVVLSNACRPNAVALLRDADFAMIQAKQRGKSRFVVFDQTLYDRALCDNARLVRQSEVGPALVPLSARDINQPGTRVDARKAG